MTLIWTTNASFQAWIALNLQTTEKYELVLFNVLLLLVSWKVKSFMRR